MRVTFLTAGSEHLGVEALIAFVRRQGHEARLVYEPKPFSSNTGPESALLARWLEPRPEETAQRVVDTAPDLVAVTSYTITHRWCVAVARAIKRLSDVPIVVGGAHASGAPRETIAEPAFDAVVEGEGEEALVELLEAARPGGFTRTDVANAWFEGPRGSADPIRNAPRALLDDLDALPFPDKSDFYRAIPSFERELYLMARRGCPYRCAFCEYSTFPARYGGERAVRRRSVENVLAELEQWKRRGVVRKVFFWDAIFTLDVGWMAAFAEGYRRRIGLPWECYTHPHTLSEEMARLLGYAGCELVRVGVQTINSATLAELDRRGDRGEVERTVRRLEAHGVAYSLDHIIGLPGDSAADQREAIRFYCDVRPQRVVVHWMTYFPGTTVFEHAERTGLVTAQHAAAIRRGEEQAGFEAPKVVVDGAHRDELREIERLEFLFHALVALPPGVVRRMLDGGLYRWMPRGLAGRHVASVASLVLGDAAVRSHLRTVLAAVLRATAHGLYRRVAKALAPPRAPAAAPLAAAAP